MNTLIKIITSFVLIFAVPNEIPFSILEKSMESNDAKTIVNLGTDKILLNISGKEGAYSHAQAQSLLTEFFTKNPKGSFTFIFKGKETSDGSFVIGNYIVKNDKFRTTFHFRTIKSESKLESLTISK
jgi:hypothetical protein